MPEIERLLPGRKRWNRFLFEKAIARMKELGLTEVVEIGAIRDAQPNAEYADGWSTLYWIRAGLKVTTVDNDPKAHMLANRLITDKLGPAVEAEWAIRDGRAFLADHPRKIGLLYLDGPNPNEMGQQFAVQCLDEVQFLPCLVLVDDCDFSDGGKGKYVIPRLLEWGYREVANNIRQILMEEVPDVS